MNRGTDNLSLQNDDRLISTKIVFFYNIILCPNSGRFNSWWQVINMNHELYTLKLGKTCC